MELSAESCPLRVRSRGNYVICSEAKGNSGELPQVAVYQNKMPFLLSSGTLGALCACLMPAATFTCG